MDPMAGGATGARPKNAVESLLGEHSDLVNLDNLTQVWSHIYIWTHILLHFFSEIVPAMMIIDVKLSTQLKTANPAAKNPFADQPNPFQVTILSEISFNQILN